MHVGRERGYGRNVLRSIVPRQPLGVSDAGVSHAAGQREYDLQGHEEIRHKHVAAVVHENEIFRPGSSGVILERGLRGVEVEMSCGWGGGGWQACGESQSGAEEQNKVMHVAKADGMMVL
ncbi:hypothetical protein FGB62_25g538 [Gracilaria domingensis]|nr:hypothetical protein FGB62_25g538 [Gracilaria domingensis]